LAIVPPFIDPGIVTDGTVRGSPQSSTIPASLVKLGGNMSKRSYAMPVVVTAVVGALWAEAAQAQPKVNVVETPNGGIQPQALIDKAGTLHLIHFKGDPAAGDLFYVHKD